MFTESKEARPGANTFWYGGADQVGARLTARISFVAADRRVVQTTENVFVHASPEVQRASFADVAGRVELGAGQGAAANTRVELVDDNGVVLQAVDTTGEGAYRFKNVDAATYKVRVVKDGFVGEDIPVAAAAGAEAAAAPMCSRRSDLARVGARFERPAFGRVAVEVRPMLGLLTLVAAANPPVVARFEHGQVLLRASWPGSPEVGIGLTAVGGEPVGGVAPRVEGRRTVYGREGVLEWWELTPAGLEQGFVVDDLPAHGALVLDLALRGGTVEVDAGGTSATWHLPIGTLRYEALVAWDARGDLLPASMEQTARGLRLVVDTEGAVAPITVDPLVLGTTWEVTSGQRLDSFADALASAGDVNGDGYADVIVSAFRYDNAFPDAGAAYLYRGSSSGLAVVPSWTVEGARAGAMLGVSVSSAGDVDGDGYDDVLVGSAGLREVQVYRGSAGGLVTTPARTLPSTQPYDAFGDAVASAGDVNGDGYGDVVVGANEHNVGPSSDVGAAFLYLGSAAGLSPIPAWAQYGGRDNNRFGYTVAGAGDVNGDGYDDVVIGATLDHPASGARLYLGSAAGLDVVPVWAIDEAPSTVAPAGDVNGDGYADVAIGPRGDAVASIYLGTAAGLSAAAGWSVAGAAPTAAGDLDGDGFGDVVLIDRATDELAFFLGSPAGPGMASAWRVGRSFAPVAGAGDVDADGHDDVVAGTTTDTPTSGERRMAVLFPGSGLSDLDGDGRIGWDDVCPAVADALQLDADGDQIGNACDDPTLDVLGAVSPGQVVELRATAAPSEVVAFGSGAGGVGPCGALFGGLCLDLGAGVPLGVAMADASGVAVLALRVPAALRPNASLTLQAAVDRGAASVKSTPLVIDGTTLDWDLDGLVDATETALGTDPTAADTDGDGLTDLDEVNTVHLDPRYADSDGDGAQDPADACPAGDDTQDTDGDGRADACDLCPAVADPTHADGDQDGLGDVCEGDVLLASGWTEEGQVLGLQLGREAASAGDVNGDGYDDVVLGVAYARSGQRYEGVAYLYLGSSAGLAAAPSWTVEGDRPGAELGSAVAGAGDVNGDGFDDVLVSAPGIDHGSGTGEVSLFLGSSAGLSAARSWVALGSPQSDAFGSAVAGAGDVNGDGYDDVLVSDPEADLVPEDANNGRVWLYLGSPGGLSAAPSWTVSGDGHLEYYGAAVASAGDVNGDGFGDVAVGATGYSTDPWDWGALDGGAVFVYLGSPSGPSLTPASSVFGEVSEARLGTAVASGDLNGDGFSDLAVGAPGWWEGLPGSDMGAVLVYLGSATGLSSGPVWRVEGRQVYGQLGASVAAADVNGDGHSDFVVGAPRYSLGQEVEGAAIVVLGSAAGPAPGAAWLGQSDQAGHNGQYNDNYVDYGDLVAAAGDVDGDGLDDVLVGAPFYDTAARDAGKIWLYLGHRP